VPMPDPTIEERYSLGTAYVASALAADFARRGKDLDLSYLNDLDYAIHTPEQIAGAILKTRPEVVGLGLFAWNQHVARRVAGILRREDPSILIVGGGPWVSSEGRSFAAANPVIDVVIQGDGEVAFAEVVRRRTEGADTRGLSGIPGTVVRADNGIVETEPVRVDPNSFPSPYLSGFVDARFSIRVGIRRGCNQNCRYCNWGGGFSKPMTVDHLAADMKWAAKRGASEVWFVDSAINRRPADLRRIASALDRMDEGDSLMTSALLDYRAIDDERFELLRRCRLDSSDVGLQSINPKALKIAGRWFDRRSFETAVERLRSIGRVVVDIILGLPGDDPDGFRRTVDYLASLDVHVHMFLLMALPGSDYSINRDKYGLNFNEDGVPFLLKSDSFTADDLVDCAAYFVTQSPRKSGGSDFTTANPRFSRYPYNYSVPMQAFQTAHERYGDPLPPEPSVPGDKGRGDARKKLKGILEDALGADVLSNGLRLGSIEARITRVYNDRVQIDLTDGSGNGAEAFLRPRTQDAPAFMRAGPFDIWYIPDSGMAEEQVCHAIEMLAAIIESGGT